MKILPTYVIVEAVATAVAAVAADVCINPFNCWNKFTVQHYKNAMNKFTGSPLCAKAILIRPLMLIFPQTLQHFVVLCNSRCANCTAQSLALNDHWDCWGSKVLPVWTNQTCMPKIIKLSNTDYWGRNKWVSNDKHFILELAISLKI